MIVINSIDKTRLSGDGFSYSGDGVAWKARVVLFMGFAAMAGGLACGVCVMVLKYVVNDASWPALWMGVSNVIANALVMLRYVFVWCRVRCELLADVSQLGHLVGEPEYGGRLYLQPGFVRMMRRTCSCSYHLFFVYIWGITCHTCDGASNNIHMPFHMLSRVTQPRGSYVWYFTVNASLPSWLVTLLTPT